MKVPSTENSTIPHSAIENNDSNPVKLSLSDLNTPNKENNTPLYLAVTLPINDYKTNLLKTYLKLNTPVEEYRSTILRGSKLPPSKNSETKKVNGADNPLIDGAYPKCVLSKLNGNGVEFARIFKGLIADYAGVSYKEAVMKHIPQVQYDVGKMYFYGENVQQDYKKSFELYTSAAIKGHAGAQFRLANMLRQGYNNQDNGEKIASLYQQAAIQGHAGAQFNLAACCRKGLGVQKDKKETVRWYELAAEQGNTKAKAALIRLNKT